LASRAYERATNRGGIKDRGDFRGHQHSSSRQRKDHRLSALVLEQRFGKLPTCIGPILKQHAALPLPVPNGKIWASEGSIVDQHQAAGGLD